MIDKEVLDRILDNKTDRGMTYKPQEDVYVHHVSGKYKIVLDMDAVRASGLTVEQVIDRYLKRNRSLTPPPPPKTRTIKE